MWRGGWEESGKGRRCRWSERGCREEGRGSGSERSEWSQDTVGGFSNCFNVIGTVGQGIGQLLFTRTCRSSGWKERYEKVNKAWYGLR